MKNECSYRWSQRSSPTPAGMRWKRVEMRWRRTRFHWRGSGWCLWIGSSAEGSWGGSAAFWWTCTCPPPHLHTPGFGLVSRSKTRWSKIKEFKLSKRSKQSRSEELVDRRCQIGSGGGGVGGVGFFRPASFCSDHITSVGWTTEAWFRCVKESSSVMVTPLDLLLSSLCNPSLWLLLCPSLAPSLSHSPPISSHGVSGGCLHTRESRCCRQ